MPSSPAPTTRSGRARPHVEQTGDSTGGIVGVEGTKDQVSSERGLNGYLSCFAIANFSHHNDVGVLTENRSQTVGKGQIDARVHLDLPNTIELVLDGVFHGDDIYRGRVDALEGAIEGGRFATAGRSSDQDNAMRAVDKAVIDLEEIARKANVLELKSVPDLSSKRSTTFTKGRGHHGDTNVDLSVARPNGDPSVLREALLGDI